jgi:hypothetical protein
MIEQALERGAIAVLRDRGHQVRIVVRGRHQPASAPADRSAAVSRGRNLIRKNVLCGISPSTSIVVMPDTAFASNKPLIRLNKRLHIADIAF